MGDEGRQVDGARRKGGLVRKIAYGLVVVVAGAGVFFIAGIGCAITGVKIFMSQRRFEKNNSEIAEGYRQNVRIHIDDHGDR